MKSRPILMSAAMVKALLAGTKTQTRRVVKNPDHLGCLTGDCPHQAQDECGVALQQECPHGKPGDLLWVRETWRVSKRHDAMAPRDIQPRMCTVAFAAGGSIANQGDGPWKPDDDDNCFDASWMGRTRPGIHQPRWASRLTLRITGVRVQRLQEISEADAQAEGAAPHQGSALTEEILRQYRNGYADVWESINGPGSWAENPFVWCVSFETIKGNVRFGVSQAVVSKIILGQTYAA